MKKYKILGFLMMLAMVLLLGNKFVMADDQGGDLNKPTTSPSTVEQTNRGDRVDLKNQLATLRGEAKQKMEALKESIKTEKDAIKAKLEENRIVGREKALERFDGAITRMTTLKDKVSAYIVTVKAKGVDTSSAEGFVATADTKLTAASAKITEATNLLATSTSTLTKDQRTQLQTLTKDIQSLVKDAHAALGDALKSLRASLKVKMELPEKNDNENKTTSSDN